MNLVSFEFALFLGLVLPLNWLLRPMPNLYRAFLLLSSYVFYASFNLKFVLILLIFSFQTWFFALIFHETRDKRFRFFCVSLYVAFSLGILIFFKYYEMLYLSLDRLLGIFKVANPVPLMDVFLPIGISFFTFQGMSYAIDVYRDDRAVVKNPLDVFVFIAFFPTILSGPILRARNFIPQLIRESAADVDFHRAFFLILSGLMKKVVVAGYLSEHLVRQVFAAPEGFTSGATLAGALAYSMQIYCDFSGYSDLAQGIALLLGFAIPDNFNSPYTASDLRDFWRRWHITFSTWLRDYLYIPLGGNRKGKTRKFFNLVMTMALGGLWHGAAYNFLVWGFIHGFGLVVVHLVTDRQTAKCPPEPQIAPWRRIFRTPRAFLGWLATFGYVSLSWVFFGAEDAGKAMDILARIAALSPDGAGAGTVIPAIIGLVMAFELLRPNLRGLYDATIRRMPLAAQGASLGILVTAILKLGPEGVPPFIYFQF